MAWGNPEQLQVEREIADEFEKKNPKLRVHLFMVPGSSYPDKLQLMLASRTAPDVMRVDHYMFPALVKKDYFLDLEPLIAAEPKGFVEDFVPTALEECCYQGKLHAMNVLFGGVQLYYNKTLFKEAGLRRPLRTLAGEKMGLGRVSHVPRMRSPSARASARCSLVRPFRRFLSGPRCSGTGAGM